MIKPSDLRIGNYVIDPIHGIKKIEWGKLIDYNARSYKPVPITERILELAGFEKNGVYWSKRDLPTFELMQYYDEESRKDLFYFTFQHIVLSWPFEYVHQLQNLYFALNALELEINL